MSALRFNGTVLIKLTSENPADMIAAEARYLERKPPDPEVRGYKGQDDEDNHHVVEHGVNGHLYLLRSDIRRRLAGEKEPGRWFLTDIRLDTTRGWVSRTASGGLKYRVTLVYAPPGSTQPAFEDREGWLPKIKARFYPETPEGSKEKVDMVAYSDVHGFVNRSKDGAPRNVSVNVNKKSGTVKAEEPVYAVRFNPFAENPEDILYLTEGVEMDGKRVTDRESEMAVARYNMVKDADKAAREAINRVLDAELSRTDTEVAKFFAEASVRGQAAAEKIFSDLQVSEPERRAKAVVDRIDWDKQLQGRRKNLDREAFEAAWETAFSIMLGNVIKKEDPTKSVKYALSTDNDPPGRATLDAMKVYLGRGYTNDAAWVEAVRVVRTFVGPYEVIAAARAKHEKFLAARGRMSSK
ncbi:hypothetical protein HYW18_03510 [Candidatus Uhrbacteria bacterium]|nr:hypothetical protein [Candidatus Uhrbacteria bacterium]